MPEFIHGRLKKELGLFDVFAVSTGAMFSSGFFLLPGLAFAQTGASVVLAYLLAAILILPAMFSVTELSTALPKSGGSYFFLDRSLGPLAGTIGGLGTYFALTLKTAFALIGIGAYAAIFVELPIKPVAIALTIVFVMINIFGAKETTTLQRWLVTVLLAVMAMFIVQAVIHVAGQPVAETRARFDPFFTFGVPGLLSTVGFVFVSYAGLTKVASVAEEVRNPDRNLPLGMILSLAVTAVVYGAGVFAVVAVVEPGDLEADLRPIATASAVLFEWMPANLGVLLIVIAALAAFASTGNAGLLSSSRYPFAMARDRLLPDFFARLGRFQTPTPAILVTGGIMIGFILLLDAEGIAKLASAFQLAIFVLLNFAVIVMRESRITSYDPGYRSPLYPWMQLFGIVTSLALIAYMGWTAVLFTFAIGLGGLIWYIAYARGRVQRHGAIFHWFGRLGLRQDEGLDREFRGIMKEKGLRQHDPFEEVVARAGVIDLTTPCAFTEVVDLAAARLAEQVSNPAEDIRERFLQGAAAGETPVAGGVALPHFRTVAIDAPALLLVRCHFDLLVPGDDPLTPEIEPERTVQAVFFLVSPEADPAQHLRILAEIAGRVDEPSFMERWRRASDEQAIRETLLREDHFLQIVIDETHLAAGRLISELELPRNALVAVIRRDDERLIPGGDTRIAAGDRLMIIGEPASIEVLRERGLR